MTVININETVININETVTVIKEGVMYKVTSDGKIHKKSITTIEQIGECADWELRVFKILSGMTDEEYQRFIVMRDSAHDSPK
jgi:hypothetical protein